jgi:hypothetical protein
MNKPPNRRSVFRFAILVPVLALGAACGPLHRGSEPSTTLVFSNESLDQAAVYAAGPNGNAIRIGTVFPGRTDTLVVPSSLVGEGSINVTARLLARSTVPRTGSFAIHAGDQFLIRLPPDENLLVVLPGRISEVTQ